MLLQFLIEAVALSSFGGLVGVALATLASIGVIFGYFPAQRAARLDPIAALRHESIQTFS